MNFSTELSGDMAIVLGCDLSLEDFFEHMDEMGWTSLLESGHLTGVFLGPVLWSLCWLGIALNILVIFPDLFLTFSSTSIFTSAISLTLVMQALLLLCRRDLHTGNLR